MKKSEIIFYSVKKLGVTIYDTKWIPFSSKFIVLGMFPKGTGYLQMIDLNKGELKEILQKEEKKPFKCGTFGASFIENRQLATGDFEGQLSIWDIENFNKPVWSVKAHNEIINCIDGCGGINIGSGAPEIVTGSRDGKVCVWDPRINTPVSTLQPINSQKLNDCWSVCFGNSYNDERFICSGYDNGEIKMFDLKMNKLYWESKLENGICCIEFDKKDILMNKLLVTLLEGKFKIYDLTILNDKKGFSHITEYIDDSTIWCGKHLPQNKDIFITTNGIGTIQLYKYNYPSQRKKYDPDVGNIGILGNLELLISTNISSQPILSFDWNFHKEGLFVCGSLDQNVRVGFVTNLS